MILVNELIIEELDNLKINVSSDGKIITLHHNKIRKNGRIHNTKGRTLKPGLDKYGYDRVVLTNSGIRKTYLVHRLVARAFIPNIDCKPTINHINGIKTDNRVENLEWATQKEQKKHSIEHHLCDKNIDALRKHNESICKKILYKGTIYNSLNEASLKLGIHSETVKNRGGILL